MQNSRSQKEMMKPSRTPIYNLTAVLHETGLKADLLRAWERRYNLPKPERTSGGHRLYSEYDIQTIKWLKYKLTEGFSISRAVDLWKDRLSSGVDPLSENDTTPAADFLTDSLVNTDQLRREWLESCLAFDSSKASSILDQALTIHPVETVCVEILLKGLHEIGHDWYTGRVTAQQEHFTSSLANRRVETLISLTPLPFRGQTVLIGGPQGEQHLFPILLLDLFLRRRGLNVVNLGCDIPIDQMQATASGLKPDLIVLAAQTITSAATLQQTFAQTYALGVPLAYGGLIYTRIPALRECLPAHYLGDSLQKAPAEIENLLASPQQKPLLQCPGEKYQDLISAFQKNRARIDLTLLQKSTDGQLPFEFLNDANDFFANGLIASLQMGDPAYLEPDIHWLSWLLVKRDIPGDRLAIYLETYRDAVNMELGLLAAPITDWLTAFLTNLTHNSENKEKHG